jgi:hypothetical protein
LGVRAGKTLLRLIGKIKARSANLHVEDYERLEETAEVIYVNITEIFLVILHNRFKCPRGWNGTWTII